MENGEEGLLVEITDPESDDTRCGYCEQAELKCLVGRMLGVLDNRGCALKPPAGMQLEIMWKDGRISRGSVVEECKVVPGWPPHTQREVRLLLRHLATGATTSVLGSQILSIGWWVPGTSKK